MRQKQCHRDVTWLRVPFHGAVMLYEQERGDVDGPRDHLAKVELLSKETPSMQ